MSLFKFYHVNFRGMRGSHKHLYIRMLCDRRHRRLNFKSNCNNCHLNGWRFWIGLAEADYSNCGAVRGNHSRSVCDAANFRITTGISVLVITLCYIRIYATS